MDLKGVVRVVQGGTEIKGIWLGTLFLWPDPWNDRWDEGTSVLWENVWTNAWSPAPTV